MQITCRVLARRPFPTKPGESRNGLRASTTAYKISPEGSKKLVPSEVHQFGGGGGGFGLDPEPEWVGFDVHIPLEPAERDTEAREYLAKLEKSMVPEQLTEDAHQRGLERVRELVYQHRLGHFQVECRRYFVCNYGGDIWPFDKLFGTFRDGLSDVLGPNPRDSQFEEQEVVGNVSGVTKSDVGPSL